jgi:hypothetical protein
VRYTTGVIWSIDFPERTVEEVAMEVTKEQAQLKKFRAMFVSCSGGAANLPHAALESPNWSGIRFDRLPRRNYWET